MWAWNVRERGHIGNRFGGWGEVQFDLGGLFEQVAEFLQQALTHVLEAHGGRGVIGAENAGKDVFLGSQGIEHAFLDRIFGNQVDDLHRGWLAMTVGAGDALFKNGGVPRQVKVDDQAGGLQVETHAARVGGEEDPAVGVVEKFLDEFAAFGTGHVAGQFDVTQANALDDGLSERQHGGPLAEYDGFVAVRGDVLG